MSATRRPRLPGEEWEDHKAEIRRLYLEEDRKLEGDDGVMDIMLRKHKFGPTKSQFETKFKKWGFIKHAKKTEWQILGQVLAERKLQGKVTDVYLRGERMKPTKVRKQTRRHRHGLATKSTLQDLIQRLPHYMSIQTPQPRTASLSLERPRGALPSGSLVGYQASSPGQENNISAAYDIPALRSQTFAGGSVALTECQPFGSKEVFFRKDSLRIEGSPHIQGTPNHLQFERLDSFHGRRQASFGMQHSYSSVYTVAHDAPMGSLIALKDCLQISLQRYGGNVSPAYRDLIRVSKDVPRSGSYRLHDLENGQTGQLLRSLPLDFAVAYRVMFSLVNNLDVLDRLRKRVDGDEEDGDEEDGDEEELEVGIRYLHSLSERTLSSFLDSVPDPYSLALEQSLLCTAVELDADCTLNTILRRSRLDLNNVISVLHGSRYTLLERSTYLGNLEITLALLKSGADPERFFTKRPLHLWSEIYGYEEPEDIQDIPMLFEVFDFLFPKDLPLKPGFFDAWWPGPRFARRLVALFQGPKSASLVTSGFLQKVLGDWEEFEDMEAAFIVQSVLCRDYPNDIRTSEAFMCNLTAALEKAMSQGRKYIVDILLYAGAIPNACCLAMAIANLVYDNRWLAVINHFLELGVDPNTTINSSGCYPKTPLSMAIRCQDQALLDSLEKKGFLSPQKLKTDGLLPALNAASSCGNIQLLRKLLPLLEAIKPRRLNETIDAAMFYNQIAAVVALVEAGIRPSKGALFSAIYRKNTSLVRLFMDMKLDLEPTATSTDYALVLEAVKWGRYDLVKDLVLAGADLHFSEYYTTQTKPGRITFATPLVASIYASNTEITNLLLDLGAIYKDNARPTPLEVFNLSLPWASKARLDVDTPLTAALVMNNLRLADHLILLGADPYDNVAMKFATKNGNMSLVKYLLEAIQKRYGLGQPHYGADALHNALIRNDIAILEDLAKHADATSLYRRVSPEVSSKLVKDSSALARAISHEGPLYLEMIRGFMQTGIDPDSIVFEKANLKDKRTALLHAISCGRLEVVKELVKFGARMDLPPRNGVSRTPLQCAAEAGTDDIFQYLLEHVDPNEAPATDGGGTALQLAAIKGHHHIATILLQKGANVNAAPAQYHGRMAFEGAAEHGRIDMMVLLSKHGLDLLGNDEAQYKQAIKLANLEGHAGAVQLVEQLYTTAKEENVRNSTAGTGDEMAWSNSYENGWIGSADSMEVAMDDYLNL